MVGLKGHLFRWDEIKWEVTEKDIRINEKESLVLTKDGYLDFPATSVEQNLLPSHIQEAFTDTSLLFPGCRIVDWGFSVLFRILAELHIQVYWPGCREFAFKLRTRWEAFNGDT